MLMEGKMPQRGQNSVLCASLIGTGTRMLLLEPEAWGC